MSSEHTAGAVAPVARQRIESSWLSNIVHDLRGPLFAARGYTRMVLEERGAALPDSHRQYLNSVLDSLAVIMGLVEELNDFPAVAALSSAPVNLGELLRRAAAELRPSALERKLNIVERIPASGLYTIGDRERLDLAVRTMLRTAVDFTSSSGTVELEAAEDEEIIRARVSISTLITPRESEPSFAIPRQILRLHGGSLAVVRPAPESCQVVYELPLLRQSECIEQARAQPYSERMGSR